VKTCIVGLLAAVVLAASPRSAAADPVTITAGQWAEVANIDGGGISLVSNQFSISGAWDCGANAAGWCGAARWAPASTVDFTTQADGRHAAGAFGTLNGAPFVGSFDSTQLVFSVAPFMLPGATPGGSNISFSIPFTMSGILTLNNQSGATAFSNSVNGSGLLAFRVQSVQFGGAPMYALDPLSTSFTFESTASATPEPATMLLFASGLVAVGARSFRRRA